METEYSLASLEQNCQRPGNWKIEGFRVTQRGGKWRISGVPGTFPNLRKARQWIVDELNGLHSTQENNDRDH